MNIYDGYAQIIIRLHQHFYKLIMTEFNLEDQININNYINNASIINLNDVFYKRISFSEINIGNQKKKIELSFNLHNSSQYGSFNIVYRSYSGLVASNALKKQRRDSSKHGLFDLYFNTGARYSTLYNGDATHYNVFEDLRRHVTFKDCLNVWSGKDFYTGEKNVDKIEALLTLSILMFEQELNYGELSFQQYTNFSISRGFRPRDMLMGFLDMMYNDPYTYNAYPFWFEKYGVKKYPHFGLSKDERNYGNLDLKYKRYFEKYRNTYRTVPSIFESEEIKSAFINLSIQTGDNPNIKLI